MTRHGTFVWNELETGDVAGAKAFYGELLGWRLREMPTPEGSTYTIAHAGEKEAGGMMQVPEARGWVAYIAVDDVDAATRRVAELGGTVHRQPFDIPPVGRMSVVADPQGAVFCLITLSSGDD